MPIPAIRLPTRLLQALTLLCLSMLLGGCQATYFAAVNALDRVPADTLQTAVFDPEHRLGLDVYRSADTPSGAPVLVFIYGGSWRGGERDWYRFIGRSLAVQGLIVVIPDYRKYPQTTFPGFVHDAAAAVRYARDHAGAWGGDGDRLFLAGHSAGAHIAMLLATDARYLQAEGMLPNALKGVIGIAGPYDFAPITEAKLLDVFPDVDHQPQTQPITFVDGDEPPVLLLHGLDDGRVWPRNSERLAKRLRSVGVEVQLHLYPGVGHASIMKALGARYLDNAPTRADLVQFIAEH